MKTSSVDKKLYHFVHFPLISGIFVLAAWQADVCKGRVTVNCWRDHDIEIGFRHHIYPIVGAIGLAGASGQMQMCNHGRVGAI